MEALRACPFCGEDCATLMEDHRGCEIICENPDCDDMSEANWTREHAIEIWNTRPIEDALRAQVDALVELVRAQKHRAESVEWDQGYTPGLDESFRNLEQARAKCRALGLEV